MMGFTIEPTLPTLDASSLPQIIPLYLVEQSTQVHEKTAVIYRDQLRPFVIWLDMPDRTTLRRDDLVAFADWLSTSYRTQYGRPPAHNTRCGILKRVRSLLRWAFLTGRCTIDVSGWVPTLTPRPRRRRTLTDSSLLLMLQAAEQGRKPERDSALIAFLAATGARRQEAFHVRVENLTFHADGSGYSYLAIAKGDKPRTVIFDRHTGRLLGRYLDSIHAATGPLWPSIHAPRTIYDIVDRVCDRAGLPHSGPHDLRKLFITNWYRSYPAHDGRAEFFLHLQVGHAAENVTQEHYALMTSEDIQAFYVSPMDRPEIAVFVAGL